MRQRLDQALVTRGLVRTRSRARDAIQRGLVRVGDEVAEKSSLLISESDSIAIDTDAAGTAYVSRGALKLLAGLNSWSFDPAGRTALDLGASTGGFTQVLLERGAARVFAVDAGHSQLHETLKIDPRVTCLEAQDARTLNREIITQPVTAIVADVSFISLQKVLPAALALAGPDAWLVALVKPQFETAGPHEIGKGGIVRDAAVRAAAVGRVSTWLAAQPGWHVTGLIVSPIAGGSGNIEYLLGAAFRA